MHDYLSTNVTEGKETEQPNKACHYSTGKVNDGIIDQKGFYHIEDEQG